MSLEEKCKQLLNLWISQNAKGIFKMTGPYWEVLYPILLKYAPAELKKYEIIAGEKFITFNEKVKQLVESGDEDADFGHAITFLNQQLDNYAVPNDMHFVDIDGETIQYLPNQIENKDYWGREEE